MFRLLRLVDIPSVFQHAKIAMAPTGFAFTLRQKSLNTSLVAAPVPEMQLQPEGGPK